MLKIDCSGKRYLVTGGAGIGVGAGICEAIAKSGGQIIINDLDSGKINEALEKYPNAIGVPCDVSIPNEVDDMFAFINKEYGVVHGLVNNAGIGLRKRAHNTTESEFDQLYNIDVKGVWLMAKAFANQLIANNQIGHLVNISSVHAHATTLNHAIYSSAKMAVEGLTRGMSVELGEYGIRCNAVAPGYVDSEQGREAIATWSDNPKQWEEQQRDEYQSLKHFISPRDCGNAVVFLLSDLARSITGQTLIVDGGFTNLLYGNSFLGNKTKQ
ncbi:SDR family NAD(P)-dependent oxidoreductase [Flagellimonas sp. S3867]|uniref:SDR family NAD(P)-dependent oxidoreductase n=1 Tax=Flagellimonas sp. S3867 TaxID=2768063 RepID=UPI0016880B18|nr:SDR family oxidoreductase [Flagellimonas sp. S3867]